VIKFTLLRLLPLNKSEQQYKQTIKGNIKMTKSHKKYLLTTKLNACSTELNMYHQSTVYNPREEVLEVEMIRLVKEIRKL